MSRTFRHLVDFLNYRSPEQQLAVGALPDGFKPHLDTRESDILVKRVYAQKIFRDHRLRPEHFYLIQPILDYGRCSLHNGQLLFLYDDREIFQKAFKLVVKAGRPRGDLWLVTYHKLEPDDLRTHLKRGDMIRDFVEK